jgi:ATP-dependent exoDNAse (exonuclease V) beta subunit
VKDSRVLVVRASAGTGKTFRLAHRYLGLLFAGARPEEILATTFTRKAAGEILGRILTRLAESASDDKARREMFAHLSPVPEHEPSAAECATLLQTLLARLHSFQVRTLDSWFVHLARLQGAELGLPPAWSVLDPAEAEAQDQETTAALIEDLDEARIRDLMRDLQQQEFGRGVHEALTQLTNDGLGILRDSSAEAWTVVDAGLSPVAADVKALVHALARLEVPGTRNWPSNLEKMRLAAAQRDWSGWLTLTPIKNLRADNPNFDRQPIPDAVVEVLEEGTRIALQALLHERALRLAAARALLDEADVRVEAARRRAGAFAFDDFPRWLQSAALNDEAAAFRLDGRLRHVLLDEFQDTAAPQWRALRPLVDAALKQSTASLFCVGDGKQSIYGWRAGEPRLLGAVAEAYRARSEPLATSFRSAQAVLDVVNDLFGTLPARVAGWYDDAALATAAARFAEHWEPHRAARPKTPGRFELWVAEDPNARAVARAEALLEELRAAGRPQAEIAILTRKNADVAVMIEALRARGIAASAEGNVLLTDSMAVNAALAALDLADHPQDTASARLVAVSPLAQALEAAENLHERAREPERSRFAARVRRELLAQGVGAWLARLLAAPAFAAGGAFAGRDARRFARLVEAGHAWDARTRGRAGAALRPSAFAAHARALKLEDPAAAQVRVMTVHKSKGLEFDAVVLALGGGRGGGGGPFWTERADPAEPMSGVAFSGNDATRGADKRLDALEQATDAAGWYDNLCVLYVGMTRAKQRLEVVVSPAKDKVLDAEEEKREELERGYAFSLPGLLRVAYKVAAANENAPVHASGAERGDWGPPPRGAEDPPSAVAAGHPWPASTSVRAPAPKPVLPRWTASHAGKDPAVRLRVLAAEPREDARPRGIAIHKLFEQVEWLEDFRATDAELVAVLRDLDDPPTESDARAWIADFRAMLHKPHVREALTRPAGVPREHLTVWRERRFAISLPEPGRSEPAILRGSFDRAVLVGPPDAPTSATILDFKTGASGNAEAEGAKRESYAPQMDVYRQALGRLIELSHAKIDAELCFVDEHQPAA